jgi:hypothetical protein
MPNEEHKPPAEATGSATPKTAQEAPVTAQAETSAPRAKTHKQTEMNTSTGSALLFPDDRSKRSSTQRI